MWLVYVLGTPTVGTVTSMLAFNGGCVRQVSLWARNVQLGVYGVLIGYAGYLAEVRPPVCLRACVWIRSYMATLLIVFGY